MAAANPSLAPSPAPSIGSPNEAPAGTSPEAKTAETSTPRPATANRPAMRLTALLMPDASPECSFGTAPMMAVESGDTHRPMPTPRIAMAG